MGAGFAVKCDSKTHRDQVALQILGHSNAHSNPCQSGGRVGGDFGKGSGKRGDSSNFHRPEFHGVFSYSLLHWLGMSTIALQFSTDSLVAHNRTQKAGKGCNPSTFLPLWLFGVRRRSSCGAHDDKNWWIMGSS